MITKFKVQSSKFKAKFQEGFTLIELMIVLSITAVLGTLGVAGFTTYNQIQVLQSSASEVATMLNLAKSRAQSQIKPSGLCPGETLKGYSVKITENKKYTLYPRCSVGGDIENNKQEKSLPQDLIFDSNLTFFFPVQKGGIQSPNPIQVKILGYGLEKIVIITSLGGVSIK